MTPKGGFESLKELLCFKPLFVGCMYEDDWTAIFCDRVTLIRKKRKRKGKPSQLESSSFFCSVLYF